MTYTEAMERGLALLDEHFPNWFTMVDTDTLEMSSCGNCVIGQLFPNEEYMFSESVQAMWAEFGIESDSTFTYEWARKFGFDGVFPEDVNWLWIDEIQARKSGLNEPDGADREQWETTTPPEVYDTDEDYDDSIGYYASYNPMTGQWDTIY